MTVFECEQNAGLGFPSVGTGARKALRNRRGEGNRGLVKGTRSGFRGPDTSKMRDMDCLVSVKRYEIFSARPSGSRRRVQRRLILVLDCYCLPSGGNHRGVQHDAQKWPKQLRGSICERYKG